MLVIHGGDDNCGRVSDPRSTQLEAKLDVSSFDIFVWVIAFLLFVGLLYSLANMRGKEPFLAVLSAFICAMFCLVLTMSTLRDAEHRAQDKLAKRDLAAAGYKFTNGNRLHVTLPIGTCEAAFDVRRIDGIYRPVLPGFKNGHKYWAVLTPTWQKKTACPA